MILLSYRVIIYYVRTHESAAVVLFALLALVSPHFSFFVFLSVAFLQLGSEVTTLSFPPAFRCALSYVSFVSRFHSKCTKSIPKSKSTFRK